MITGGGDQRRQRRLQVDRRRQDLAAPRTRRRRSRSRRSSSIRNDPNLVLLAAQGNVHAKTRRRAACIAAPTADATWTQTLYVDDSTGAQKIALGVRSCRASCFATTVRHYNAARRRPRRMAAAAAAEARRNGPTGTYSSSRPTKAQTWKEITGGRAARGLTGRTSIAVAMNTNAQRDVPHRQLRPLPLRRRRRDVAPDGRRRSANSQRTGRLQLRRLRRPAESRHRLHDQHVELQVAPTAATRSPASRARRAATIRSRCGSIRPTASACSSASTRARSSRSTAAARGARGTTSRPSRSTTSRSTTRFRTGSTRTQQDAGADRARAAAATSARSRRSTGIRSRAASAARSSPIRSIRRSSTPAAYGGIVKITYPSEQWINVSPNVGRRRVSCAQSATSRFAVRADGTSTSCSPDSSTLMVDDRRRRALEEAEPRPAAPTGAAAARRAAGGAAAGSAVRPAARSNRSRASTVGRASIWVGTNNGLIKVTRDHGETWDDVDASPTFPTRTRADVSASTRRTSTRPTAYVALDYHTTRRLHAVLLSHARLRQDRGRKIVERPARPISRAAASRA